MVGVFSTREIAIGLWILFLIIFCLCKSRNAVIGLLKATVNRHIIILFLPYFLYMGFIAYILFNIGLWRTMMIKDSIIFCTFVGISIVSQAIVEKEKTKFMQKTVTSTLKLSILISYIVNAYTFNLFFEIVSIPILFFISACAVYAEHKEVIVRNFLNTMLVVYGIFILILAVNNAIIDYQNIFS